MAPLTWGLIGGGRGSQIGPAHRLGARLDGAFDLVAAALDHDPEAGRAYAAELGVARAYGDWREMLAEERKRGDRPDLVTVATPNATHFEITKAFLQAGFNVLCEKPLTMTEAEAAEIVALARDAGRICAVNYGYTGYALVRHMRAMVARGDLGAVRVVVAEFSHGHHADAGQADNPRIRWRYDPAQMGISAQFADCGIHALHMASFVTGQQVARLSADFASTVPGRVLEDDAMVNFRMDGGAVGRLWTSAVAVGRMHGLTLQVFGEKGGLRWSQEQPNQLYFTPTGGRVTVIERGEAGLSPEADRASRVTIGHAEGMPLAFANIYADLAEAIRAQQAGRPVDPAADLSPRAEDGWRSMAAIRAAVESARNEGAWVDAAPAGLRRKLQPVAKPPGVIYGDLKGSKPGGKSMLFGLNHMTVPTLPARDVLSLARRLGFAGVEFRTDLGRPLFDGETAEDIRSAARGLRILALAEVKAFNDPGRDDETRALCRTARAAGAEAVALIPRVGTAPLDRAEQRRALKAALVALRPIIEDHGLTGLIEPLGFTASTLRHKDDAVAVLDDLGRPACFRLVHDTFHHHLSGDRSIHADLTGLVHISGVTRDLPPERMTDADRVLVDADDRLGNVAQLRALASAGWHGTASFEVFSPEIHGLRDPEAALAASAGFITSVLAGVAA